MKRKVLIIISVVVVVVLLVGVGTFWGLRLLWNRASYSGRMRGTLPPMVQNFIPPFADGINPGGRRGLGFEMGMGRRSLDSSNGFNGAPGYGMQGGKIGMHGSMMYRNNTSMGDRISVDQALEKAKSALTSYGSNLKIVEIMEFSDNFYVVVKESDTGRGAFEMLVDPFTGQVVSEPGPNMMWNDKYGHMNFNNSSQQSEMSISQAVEKASAYLTKWLPTATLEPDGIAYYGHVTFDYKVNGLTAGMLSVNSRTGDVWLHEWHGTFISEKMVE